MTILRVERKLALPATLEASTMYIVKDAGSTDHAEVYFTSNDGTEVRRLVTRTDVMGMVAGALGATSSTQIVPDIAARDALTPTLTANATVMVVDATGDPTVASGSALYIFDFGSTTWYKISEYSSLAVSLNWDAIQNKPVATVTEIDDAVAKRHAHANKANLDKIGEDAEGLLLYNGANIRTFIDSNEW